MSNPHPRFANFVHDCTAELQASPPNVLENKYMFKVGDRWVEMIYHEADDRVTFASLAYVIDPKVELRSYLIASFNFYQLFHDGMAMVVIEKALVYVCLAHRPSSP